ncbi:response regulator [Halovulum sp. GXIMD14793]
MRVLLVEDEPTLQDQISSALKAEGRAVDIAGDGEEAEFLGETEPYDAIILDLGLPKIDGLTVLKTWRQKGMDAPVLILTARGSWSDRVDGLDAGADDYLAKPFHMEELSARLRALLRRKTGQSNPVFTSDDFSFDTRTGRATINGTAVTLTAQEVMVISYLVHNAGRMISRTELSEHIYGYDGDRDSNTIAVFINRLRKKLGPDVIKTERGRGYRVDTP